MENQELGTMATWPGGVGRRSPNPQPHGFLFPEPMPDPNEESQRRGKLPRLPSQFYRGRNLVFWTFTLKDRVKGWLTPEFHRCFREQLLHVLHREPAVCPAYCLMPDHMHLLLVGLAPRTSQLRAVRYLRARLGQALAPWSLQSQAYDHVLRPSEQGPDELLATCAYIRDNPVRKGWVTHWSEWPYSDAVAVGFGDLDCRASDFWLRYGRILAWERDRYERQERAQPQWIDPGTAGYLPE